MFYTLATAAKAIEDILAECESGDISSSVSNETIHVLRQALYAVQKEEAIEEAIEQELKDQLDEDISYAHSGLHHLRARGAFNRW